MKITTKLKRLTLIFIMAVAMVFPFVYTPNNNHNVYAEEVRNEVTVTNKDFNNNPDVTYLESENGWTRVNSSSNTTAGIINISSSTFANSGYELTDAQNPGLANSDLDKKMLMINSKTSTSTDAKNQGYKSSNIIFEANSYYEISVLVKTQDDARASIYLTGFDSANNVTTRFENIPATTWQEYRFYVATDSKEITANIQLWLGTSTTSTNMSSVGSVFFDQVNVTKLSENIFPETANEKTKITNLKRTTSSVTNGDFETGTLAGWSQIETSYSRGGTGKILNVTSPDAWTANELENLGGDNSKNNQYGFVISSKQKSSIGYRSSNINIPLGSIYKISINAKMSSDISGNAYAVLKEANDVLDFCGEEFLEQYENLVGSAFYTPTTTKIVVATTDNQYQNDYVTLNFYVKGHPLYNTTANLELWLGYNDGTTEETTSGAVCFDSIKIQSISNEEFTNASTTESTNTKIEMTTVTGTPSITNGYFNSVIKENYDKNFPLLPQDWTWTSENEIFANYSVVNTNQTIYEVNKADYGNIANPGNPNSLSTEDTNNILMLRNTSNTYQSITSPSFNVSENKYYQISFDYKTIATTANTKLLTVEVLDENDKVIYIDEDINSSIWKNYKILVRAQKNTASMKIRLSLGNKDAKVTGYLYIDNVKLDETTFTETEYANYVENNKSIDFTSGCFNLVSYDTNDAGYHTPLAYTGSAESGVAGHSISGIVNPQTDASILYNTNNSNVLKNMLMIQTIDEVTYSLISNNKTSLTEGTYYKFTIDVRTILNDIDVDEEKDEYYGAEFSLSGLTDSKIKSINTNGEFKTYTLYVHATTATEIQLRFALRALGTETAGYAYFDNFTMSEIESTTFDTDKTEYEKNEDGYKLFVGDTDAEEDDSEDETDDTTTSNFDWLIIPSLILSLAVIIALVGFCVRRIKFKKFKKRKQSEYDRNKTLYRDVIRQEAEKARDEEVKQLKNQINEINDEIKRIEEINQQRLAENRKKGLRVIDKKTEKEFKAYASRHTALEKSIEKIEQQIQNISTDDYLLQLQKKFVVKKIDEETKPKKK